MEIARSQLTKRAGPVIKSNQTAKRNERTRSNGWECKWPEKAGKMRGYNVSKFVILFVMMGSPVAVVVNRNICF